MTPDPKDVVEENLHDADSSHVEFDQLFNKIVSDLMNKTPGPEGEAVPGSSEFEADVLPGTIKKLDDAPCNVDKPPTMVPHNSTDVETIEPAPMSPSEAIDKSGSDHDMGATDVDMGAADDDIVDDEPLAIFVDRSRKRQKKPRTTPSKKPATRSSITSSSL